VIPRIEHSGSVTVPRDPVPLKATASNAKSAVGYSSNSGGDPIATGNSLQLQLTTTSYYVGRNKAEDCPTVPEEMLRPNNQVN
jgi:hypothetical protein